jgi:hypothetical protein
MESERESIVIVPWNEGDGDGGGWENAKRVREKHRSLSKQKWNTTQAKSGYIEQGTVVGPNCMSMTTRENTTTSVCTPRENSIQRLRQLELGGCVFLTVSQV